VPSEKARPAAWVGAAKPNVRCALSFRAQPQRTHRAPFSLKQLRCPKCGAAETLNCHSKLYGNDPSASDGKAQGQRGQPGTLRVAVFLCGAVLGVMGRDAVVKLSAAWGGLRKHKPLVAATLDWLKCASSKLIPPEDRLAIGGGMI
jgi:hypothetical protein